MGRGTDLVGSKWNLSISDGLHIARQSGEIPLFSQHSEWSYEILWWNPPRRPDSAMHFIYSLYYLTTLSKVNPFRKLIRCDRSERKSTHLSEREECSHLILPLEIRVVRSLFQLGIYIDQNPEMNNQLYRNGHLQHISSNNLTSKVRFLRMRVKCSLWHGQHELSRQEEPSSHEEKPSEHDELQSKEKKWMGKNEEGDLLNDQSLFDVVKEKTPHSNSILWRKKLNWIEEYHLCTNSPEYLSSLWKGIRLKWDNISLSLSLSLYPSLSIFAYIPWTWIENALKLSCESLNYREIS